MSPSPAHIEAMKAKAKAAPMPRLAPVINTARPLNVPVEGVFMAQAAGLG